MDVDLSLPADVVAPKLLGALLSHSGVRLRLSEVEAYLGLDDPASHAFGGPTPRSSIMFGPPGRIYVYLSYGVHWNMNLVCGPSGTASAVLLRAATVVSGIDVAQARRGAGVPVPQLARGPGNLGKTLGLTREDNGACLGVGDWSLEPGPQLAHRAGPRVGVSAAADIALRFWLPGDPSVSAYRRSARAPRPSPQRVGAQDAPRSSLGVQEG